MFSMDESQNNSRRTSNFSAMGGHVKQDVAEFSENYDEFAPPVGLDMAGHDTFLMGPKVVMLDAFVIDLLNVDTSAQTFRLKLLVNMDWEDDGTIEPETKAKRVLTRNSQSFSQGTAGSGASQGTAESNPHHHPPRSTPLEGGGGGGSTYKTGKYVPKKQFREDLTGSTWNPKVVLVNAIADENPIEAGTKHHSVKMIAGRPVISSTVLYQPECRCKFTFSNFPFDETDLVVRFGSNKWNSEQVNFMWSHRLRSMGRNSYNAHSASRNHNDPSKAMRRQSSSLRQSVDQNAIGGVGLSEFEIVRVRVETDEKDVNSMQRYDNAQGAFSQAHLIIRVRRDPFSYLLRVATVAELLMFLEVLSFYTDSDDMSERFSISGTIFLAMVSLYGPMADALPKVSVVTRVDKWHLNNFLLLFLSNVENLIAYLLHSIVNKRILQNSESLLGILYLGFVVKNLVWFVAPLKEREEYDLLLVWLEDKWDWMKDALIPWRKKGGEISSSSSSSKSKSRGSRKWGTALGAMVRLKKGILKEEEEEKGSPRGGERKNS